MNFLTAQDESNWDDLDSNVHRFFFDLAGIFKAKVVTTASLDSARCPAAPSTTLAVKVGLAVATNPRYFPNQAPLADYMRQNPTAPLSSLFAPAVYYLVATVVLDTSEYI
jgi:hypothetical protein